MMDYIHTKEGDSTMDGNIDTSDVITYRGLTGGLGGYGYGGYGAGQSGFLRESAVANGTAVKEAVDNNGQRVEDLTDNIANTLNNAERQRQFSQVNKNQVDSEFRNIDRLRDLDQRMSDGFKETAQCCCDAKLEACKQHSEVLAAIAAQNQDAVQRQLDSVTSELNISKTVQQVAAACGCCGGNSN